jgi:hypothetical protein
LKVCHYYEIKDLDAKVVLEKWTEFKQLIKLERVDITRDSQGGSQHTTPLVESSIAKQATKWPQKEETKAKKKEKILGKIVMGKEAKGFNPIECRIKNATIGDEYANLIPPCFSLV